MRNIKFLCCHRTLHKQQFVWHLRGGITFIMYVVLWENEACKPSSYVSVMCAKKFILVFINFRIQRILKIYAAHRLSMWQQHKHHQHHHHPHCCLLWKMNTKKFILLPVYIYVNFMNSENSTNTISIDDHFMLLFSQKNFLTLSIFQDLSAHILQIEFLIINFSSAIFKESFRAEWRGGRPRRLLKLMYWNSFNRLEGMLL